MKKIEKPPVNTTALSDIPLAVFLCVRGIPLINIQNKGNTNRVDFVFPDTDEVNRLKMEYLNDGLIPARSFYTTFRDLKRRVYEVMGRD